MHDRPVPNSAADHLVKAVAGGVRRAIASIREATRPGAPALGLVVDLARPHGSLIAENPLLRQQLLVLKRQIQRPKFTAVDRAVLLGASAMTGS